MIRAWKEFKSGVLIARDLNDPASLVTLFETLEGAAPSLVPTRCGFVEPLRDTYLAGQPSTLAEMWQGETFMWKSKGSEGILMPNRHRHSNLIFYQAPETKPINLGELTRFYRNLSEQLPIDFGYIHFVTEKTRLAEGWTRGMQISSPDVQHYIPYVPWGILFGEPYIKLIGEDRLLSAPAFLIESWNDSLIYMKLSESLHDTGTDIDKFENIQAGIRRHLGEDLFFRPNTPKRQFIHPTFFFTHVGGNGHS